MNKRDSIKCIFWFVIAILLIGTGNAQPLKSGIAALNGIWHWGAKRAVLIYGSPIISSNLIFSTISILIEYKSNNQHGKS